MEKTSRSFRCDSRGSVEHNNRVFIAKNVNQSKIKDNIVYVKEDIRDKYDLLFGQALKEYNAKKTKTRDKIPDYLSHIQNSKQEKPFYEIIVQFGDRDDTGVGTERGKLAVKMLDEYMRNFEKRNPNLKVFNAVLHLDEETPHLHIDFIPIATNQKRGLSTKNSFTRALHEQGIKSISQKIQDKDSSNTYGTEQSAWCTLEREYMEEIARKYGLEIDIKNDKHVYLEPEKYKQQKDKLREMEKHTEELLKKNKRASEITDDELDLILNENRFYKSEISKKEKQVNELSEKISAKFSYYEFFDDQKLSYIAEKLIANKVPCVEDVSGIYIPDYAVQTMKSIAKDYKPKTLSYRQDLKLTIDRLVYAVDNVDELFSELRRRGYQIKTGKYISIKPATADRAIRTTSLGKEYTTTELEKRIRNKRNYSNTLTARYEHLRNKSEISNLYYCTTKTVISMIYSLEKNPKKYNSEKYYSMENDWHINELSGYLSTIEHEKIVNVDDLKSRVEKLRHSLEDMTTSSDKLSRLQIAIKDLIKKAEFYYNNKDRQLDEAAKNDLLSIQNELERNKLTSVDDLEKLRMQYIENEKALAILKEKIPNTRARQSAFLKILDNYELVKNGNYIDMLVFQENNKQRIDKK